MNDSKTKFLNFFKKKLYLGIMFLLLSFSSLTITSCSSVKPNSCEKKSLDDIYIPNPSISCIIEFNTPKTSILDNKNSLTIKSCIKPILEAVVKFEKNKLDTIGYNLTIIEINQFTVDELLPPFMALKDGVINLNEYSNNTEFYTKKYKNVIFLKDTNDIVRIQYSSNVDIPPSDIPINLFFPEYCCPRDRECISTKTFFQKIELRAMGGYRINANESIHYPGEFGGTTYYKETFGFDRGGTDYTIGLESAFLFDITNSLRKSFNIPERNSFHIGPMIGIWPVDESFFIPISIHPRYTFNYNKTNRFADECHAWYIFGDLGIPFDPTFKVPIYCDKGDCKDNEYLAYFYGLGIGRDWGFWECMDLSVDLGFRVTNTPLPANTDCEECLNLKNQNPFRKISQVFIRFGLTW